MDRTFPPSRAAGLDHLALVTPHLGRDYASGRNADHGPDAPASTSALSPYLRRRLILEQEVVDSALGRHSASACEKFVQEVFWRTYFKGYLETHPAVWDNYLHLVGAGQNRLATESGLRRVFTDACNGNTGIACFDDWARELVETNWLHNHTRMWFASIWIFTLGLPWALGADFFLRHLVDGDPASNTLSWRWVAGLHTKGKAYAARAENIRRYTAGRYDPQGLNESPEPLEEADLPGASKIAPADAAPGGEVALLLHVDDLHPESLPLGEARVVRVGGLVAHAPGAVERVRAFDEAAMADGLARAAAHFGCEAGPADGDWAGGLPVVTAWAPVGPTASVLPEAIRVRRAWDSAAWPRATRGFFQVKAAIPSIMETMAEAGVGRD